MVKLIQLWVWLLLSPTAWRNVVAQIDPRLSPNFCLAELSAKQRRHPQLRQLLFLEYTVLPILMGGCVGLTLMLLKCAWPNVVFGVGVGWAACTGSAILGSWIISVAASWMASTVGGLLGGIIFGLMGAYGLIAFNSEFGINQDIQVLTKAMVLPILMASFPNGVGAGVVLNVARDRRDGLSASQRWGQQLGGIALGMLGSGLILLLGEQMTHYAMQKENALGIGTGTEQLVLGALLGGLLGAMVARHTRCWRREMGWSVALGVGVAYAASLAIGTPQVFVRGLAHGGGNALLLSVLFALAYNLTATIAGVPAGAIAGVLGSSAVHTIFVSATTGYPLLHALALSLAFTFLGLSLPWWLSFCLYPIELIWHLVLYHLTEKQQYPNPRSIRQHAAFWDEQQRLPFWGLDGYLVKVINRSPSVGQMAIDDLSQSHQRWAVRSAQIELDAQRLEQCIDVSAIAALSPQRNPHDLASDSTSPITALLLRFSRLSEDTQVALNQSSLYSQRLMLKGVSDRIENISQDLTRSQHPYTSRFRPILHRWQQIIYHHQQHLTHQAELSQTIESPYIVGIPLTQQQEMFVGRQGISAQIERLLRERRHASLLLYGQRRMGKTSLLNNLGKLLPSHIVPLFIDLQGPTSKAANHAGFLYNLARGMISSAKQYRNLILPPLPKETLIADPFTAFDEWIDDVETRLAGKTVLLALDEFEALDQALAQGNLDDNAILGMLRNLIQHRKKFKVLLSGSHTLEGMHQWASYLINLQVLHISYLQESEARQLIEHPIRDFRLQYEPSAIQRILVLTRCHPFLIQLLCAEIIALKNEQPRPARRQVTVTDVEVAVPRALISGSFFFADIEHSQHQALPLIQKIAAQGEHALYASHSSQEESELVNLVKQEILEVVAGKYRFQVELIRRWIHQSSHLFQDKVSIR